MTAHLRPPAFLRATRTQLRGALVTIAVTAITLSGLMLGAPAHAIVAEEDYASMITNVTATGQNYYMNGLRKQVHPRGPLTRGDCS